MPPLTHPPQAPNTPIASVKRARQKPSLTSPQSVPSVDTTPPTSNLSTPPHGTAPLPNISSPMHSATLVRRLNPDEKENEKNEDGSWASRKMDALFSPVLNFLNNDDGAEVDPSTAGYAANAPTAAPGDSYYAEQLSAQELARSRKGTTGEEEYDPDEFNPYLFIKQLPRYESVTIPTKICLPPKVRGPRGCRQRSREAARPSEAAPCGAKRRASM